jgi:cyclase
MRRVLAASALLLLLAAAFAQQDDFSKVEIKVSRVAGNIYLLQGSGGNIAASVGEDGILLVDDEYAPLALKIRAALKGIGVTDKPVRFIINTHFHGDHAGGNLPFASNGSTLIAHDNVRTRLSSGGSFGNGSSVHMEAQPADPGALPVITFASEVTVHVNGEDIRALHYAAGHTDGDSIIFFPKANVVHMGDDYVRYGFPFIDVESGGSVQGMIKACEEVIATLPADVKVIPGHGELSTIAELREYVTMLKDTSAAVDKALRAGRTREQMKSDKVLEPWAARWTGDFVSTDVFIDTLYNSLTHAEHAPLVKHG